MITPEFAIFGNQSASDFFASLLNKIKEDIHNKTNDYILNVDVNEWKQYFIEKYDLTPLTIYSDSINVNLDKKGKAKRREPGFYNQEYEIDTYTFQLRIPFTGAPSLFSLKPSTSRMRYPKANLQHEKDNDGGEILICFTLSEQEKGRFENEKSSIVEAVVLNAESLNKDLINFKNGIGRTFDSVYQNKKQKVESENEFFESVNININKSTDEIFKVPSIKKRKVPEPLVDQATNKKYVQSPTLDDEFYSDIIKTIYAFFRAVEKKPITYKNLDEEGLRDYVLPSLEIRYDNSIVTGETFNKGGKTYPLIYRGV